MFIELNRKWNHLVLMLGEQAVRKVSDIVSVIVHGALSTVLLTNSLVNLSNTYLFPIIFY